MTGSHKVRNHGKVGEPERYMILPPWSEVCGHKTSSTVSSPGCLLGVGFITATLCGLQKEDAPFCVVGEDTGTICDLVTL